MGSLSFEAERFRKNAGMATASTLPPTAKIALSSRALHERAMALSYCIGGRMEGRGARIPRGIGRPGRAQRSDLWDYSDSFTTKTCVERVRAPLWIWPVSANWLITPSPSTSPWAPASKPGFAGWLEIGAEPLTYEYW